jgi:hypothetical protein
MNGNGNGGNTPSRTAIRKREEPLYSLAAELCDGLDRSSDAVLVALARHLDRASRHAQGRSNALRASFLLAVQQAVEAYRVGIDYTGYQLADDDDGDDLDGVRRQGHRVRWPQEPAS